MASNTILLARNTVALKSNSNPVAGEEIFLTAPEGFKSVFNSIKLYSSPLFTK